jgi:CHAT domain-containing protein
MMYEFAAAAFHEVDLVVLSACQSGMGQLQKGEGLMSLGRGFAYAGVPSLLLTLWPLHDKSAAELMQGFYRYLEKGYPKDEALRLSKLDFLSKAGRLNSHPLYWAAPVLWGHSAPIYLRKVSKSKKWCYIWGSGLLLFMVVLALFLKKNL